MAPLLDMTGTYEPSETGGVFAYGTHAVVVAVEPDTGVVESSTTRSRKTAAP